MKDKNGNKIKSGQKLLYRSTINEPSIFYVEFVDPKVIHVRVLIDKNTWTDSIPISKDHCKKVEILTPEKYMLLKLES